MGLRVLALGFALLVLAALTVIVVIPRATQGSAMTVLTGSMTPGIPVGSIVVVRPVDPGTLQVGDVATYQREPGKGVYITHRITKVDARTSPTRFTFKGDANRGPDLKPVVPEQIRGQVWFHVPYLGGIRDGLHGKGGMTLVAMLVLAGYALSQVGAGLRERRERPPSSPVQLPIDRHLLVVTIDTDRLTSRLALPPVEVASDWDALLVRESEDTCTFVLVCSEEELDSRLELLGGFHPAQLVVVDGPVTVTGHVTGPVPLIGGTRVQA